VKRPVFDRSLKLRTQVNDIGASHLLLTMVRA
jgi:hypothetical protein